MKQKSRFSMILMVIALFGVLFGMEKVEAKTELITCEYNYSYQLAGKSATAKVVIFDNGTSYSEVLSFNGKKPLSAGLTRKNNVNKDLIESYVLATNKCPDFALIHVEPNFGGINTDNTVILSLDKKTLEQVVEEKQWTMNALIGTSTTYQAPSEIAEKYYNHVVEATDSINAEYEKYETECNEDKTKFIACMNKNYNSLSALIKNYESEIDSWVREGYISESDQRVIEFRSIASEKKKSLEEMHEGYVDPDDGTINRDYDICSIFSGTLGDIVKSLISWIKLLIPIVIIVLGIMDAISVVVSGEEKKMKEVFSRFLKRMIAGLLIIFVPSLISFLVNLSGVLEPYHIDDIWCGLWG